jgi:probable rRNA maturation factor
MTTGQTFAVDLQASPQFAAQVRPELFERAVRAAFSAAGQVCRGELTVVITDEKQVQALNRDYRGVDAPTNVLAFGEAHEQGAFVAAPDAKPYVGDIVVSYPRAVEQAAEYEHPLDDELTILVVHGALHLLGYDHETAEDSEEMWRLQEHALDALSIHWEA